MSSPANRLWNKFASILASLWFCAISGACGALAAACGKLAGRPYVGAAGRWACYSGLLGCNALMLACYNRSLLYTSSLAATTAATAVNITATGLLGRLAFGEQTSARWWAGVTCIWLGSLLLQPPQWREAAGASAEQAPAAARATGGGSSSSVGEEAEASPAAQWVSGREATGVRRRRPT